MNAKKMFTASILLFIFACTNALASSPRNVGDLVARNLLIPGLGWAGHVGMWDGNKVLEVLNKSTVIQKNTLSKFKSESGYWHARYGKGTYRQRSGAAYYGWRQRYYSPKYTTTANITEGGYVTRWKWSRSRGWYRARVRQNGKFRCDTFVTYSYLKKGLRLAWVMTPRNVFYSMPRKR